jgi:hypothetical protein
MTKIKQVETQISKVHFPFAFQIRVSFLKEGLFSFEEDFIVFEFKKGISRLYVTAAAGIQNKLELFLYEKEN